MVVNEAMNQWLKANRSNCLRTWGDEVSACWVHRWVCPPVLSYSHDVARPSNMIGLHVRPTSTCAPPHSARELSQRARLIMGEEPKQILRLFSSLNQTMWIVGLWRGCGVQSWSTFFLRKLFVFGRDVAGGRLHSNSKGKAGFLSCKCQVLLKWFADMAMRKSWPMEPLFCQILIACRKEDFTFR